MRTIWTITHDNIANLKFPEGTHENANTLYGPRNAVELLQSFLNAKGASEHPITPENASEAIQNRPEAFRFRMKDDDGEVYYYGFMIPGDEVGAELAPLKDFGELNAGCTSIEIRDNGIWNPV